MGRKRFICLCSIGALLAAAIIMLQVTQTKKKDEEMLYIGNMGEFSSEDGFYYLDSERFLQFYDYKMHKNAIVCSKPNCMHKAWEEGTPEEQRCDAYAFGCQSLFVYEGKLYLVWSSPGTGKTSLVESAPDRSSQRVVAQIDSDYLGFYAIKDGSMYFCTLSSEIKKDESGMPVQTGLSHTAFNRLNIETGKVELLKEMEQHYNGQLLIAGIYQDTILCCYGYFKEKFTGFNYEEAGRQMKWFTYHTKDGSMEESFPILEDIDMGHCEMDGEKLIYGKWRDMDNNMSDIYCYNLDTQENRKIISNSHSFSVDDHKVLARGYEESECTIYDIASKTTEKLVQEETILYVRAEYGDSFIVACYENGKSTYGIMPKKDYYNGDVNFERLDAE